MRQRAVIPFLLAFALTSILLVVIKINTTAKTSLYDPESTVTWVGPTEGYWNVGSNWSGGVPPGASDDVVIGSGTIVTYTTSASTINSIDCDGELNVSGGSLVVSAASSLDTLRVIGASVFFNGATDVNTVNLWGSPTTEGDLGGTGTMTIHDRLEWYGSWAYTPKRQNSRISGPGITVIASSATASISSGAVPTEMVLGGTTSGTGRKMEIYGSMIQNQCLRLAYGSVLDIKVGGSVAHYGTCWISNSGGEVLNAGTFLIQSGFSVNTPITNTGTIDVDDIGQVNFYGLRNYGTLKGRPSSEIQLISSGYEPYIAATSVITIPEGLLRFLSGDYLIQGSYNVGTTDVSIPPESTLTLPGTASLTLQNLEVRSGKVVLNQNLSLNNLRIDSVLSGSGNVFVNGTLNWYAGTMEGGGSTTVNGTVNITSASTKYLGATGKPRNFYANGSGSWSNGNIDASSGSGFTINPSHSLSAKGVFTGTITNNGSLNIGDSAGTLTLVGPYQQGGTGILNIEVGGSESSQYDLLNVGTLATLAGTLNVSEINGYSLVGNNLDIITFLTRSGSFTTLNLPAGGQLTYETNAVNVSAGSGVSGVSINGPSSGTINHSYTFTTTVSPSNASPPLTYLWDPEPDSGQGTDQATYSWLTVSNTVITATVSNSLGSAAGTKSINILDESVTGLSAQNSSPHLLGSTTCLTATISGGSNVLYAWDFGDGAPPGNSAQITHNYTDVGSYTAVVTATNTAGEWVTSTLVTIWGTLPTSGGTLNPAENVTFTLPTGAVTDTIILQFELQPTMTVTGYADVGIFYDLSPVYQSTGDPASLVGGKTYTIIIYYDEADIPSGMPESSLALYYWDGSAWVKEPTSVLDELNNTLTATPDHFSTWAALGVPVRIYLPLVLRN